MKTHPRRIASVMIASVLLLNMPSALANGEPDGRHNHDTIVTFTKWVTRSFRQSPAKPRQAGF